MSSVPCSHFRPLAFAVLSGMSFPETAAWLVPSLHEVYIPMSPSQKGQSWPPTKTHFWSLISFLCFFFTAFKITTWYYAVFYVFVHSPNPLLKDMLQESRDLTYLWIPLYSQGLEKQQAHSRSAETLVEWMKEAAVLKVWSMGLRVSWDDG